MTIGFAAFDRVGRLALSGIARNVSDAARAAEIGCDPRHAPYRIERMPVSVARVDLEAWRANATTDKAVDLTTNAGWEDL